MQVIEVAKTGRARCRTCRQTSLAPPRLRGPQEAGAGSGGTFAVPGEVPGRDEIEKLLAEADETAVAFPHAERAPTGRSSCLQCREPVPKDALRVAVQREVDVAGMARMGAGYLHPGCAPEFTGTADLLALLLENSRKLGDQDGEELTRALSE